VIAAWLVRFRPRQIHAKAKTRWLTADGTLSRKLADALIVANPENAAERLQAFVELKGLPIRAVERFALVPADAVGGGT
jgi:hypothetical protein